MLVYLALAGWRQRAWLLLVPPALTALWANLHGAFPAGVWSAVTPRRRPGGQAGGWRANRACRLLAGCLLATALATLVNPYGWTIYEYVGVTSRRRTAGGMGAAGFGLMIGWFWAASLLLLAGLLVLAYTRRRVCPTPEDVVLMLCFDCLPLSAHGDVVADRHCPPANDAGRTSYHAAGRGESDKPSLAAGVSFTVLLLAVVMTLPGLERHNPLLQASGRNAPRTESALQAVQERIKAQAPHGQRAHVGGWSFAWSASPPSRSSWTGRSVPDNVWQQYQDVTTEQDDEAARPLPGRLSGAGSGVSRRQQLVARVERSGPVEEDFSDRRRDSIRPPAVHGADGVGRWRQGGERGQLGVSVQHISPPPQPFPTQGGEEQNLACFLLPPLCGGGVGWGTNVASDHFSASHLAQGPHVVDEHLAGDDARRRLDAVVRAAGRAVDHGAPGRPYCR